MSNLRHIVKNPLGALGLSLVILWLGIAAMTPFFAKPTTQQSLRNPYMIERYGFSSLPSPPSEESPFGRAAGGYDIFYGIMWGSRTALKVSLIVVVTTAVIGTFLGGMGAFLGGLVDEVVMRLVDLLMGLPFVIAVMLITIILGKGLGNVMLALIIFAWRDYARVIRSRVLSVKNEEYISAAKSTGCSLLRIFFRHILPNSVQPVFVVASVEMGRIILVVAGLSFIGVGAEPGYADWGQLINFARGWIIGASGNPFKYWYTLFFPSLAIFSYALGWILLGDVLRDVLDPKLR